MSITYVIAYVTRALLPIALPGRRGPWHGIGDPVSPQFTAEASRDPVGTEPRAHQAQIKPCDGAGLGLGAQSRNCCWQLRWLVAGWGEIVPGGEDQPGGGAGDQGGGGGMRSRGEDRGRARRGGGQDPQREPGRAPPPDPPGQLG